MNFQLPIEDLHDTEWIALQRSENVLRVVVGRQETGGEEPRYIPLEELDHRSNGVNAVVEEMLQRLRTGTR